MNDIFSELVQEITSKNKDNRRNSDKNDKDVLPIKSQINCAIKQNTQEEINDISEKVKYGYREIIKRKISIFDYLFPILSVWFLLYFFQNFVINNFENTGFISYIFAFVSGIISLMLLYEVVNDTIGIVKINSLEKFRNNLQLMVNSNDIEALKKFIKSYCKDDKGFHKKIEKTNDCDYLIKLFEKDILNKKDKEADNIIKKYAFLTSGATVLSSKAWIDFIIMQMFFAKLIVELAKLYNINIGIFTFIKLVYIGLIGSSFSSLTSNIFASLVPNEIAKKTGEFTITTYIVAHLGIKVKYAIRPVIISEDDVSILKTIKLILNIQK